MILTLHKKEVKSMKKWPFYLLCAALLMTLTACGALAPATDDAPVLNAIIQKENADAPEHVAVYSQGKTAEIGAFSPDDAVFYTAAHGNFETNVESNAVKNVLKARTLIDSDGSQIEADEILAKMMQTAADTIDHEIWQFQAVVLGGRYFAFIKLNVNLHSPCILYEYDPTVVKLTELCRWDGVDLIGLSIPESITLR